VTTDLSMESTTRMAQCRSHGREACRAQRLALQEVHSPSFRGLGPPKRSPASDVWPGPITAGSDNARPASLQSMGATYKQTEWNNGSQHPRTCKAHRRGRTSGSRTRGGGCPRHKSTYKHRGGRFRGHQSAPTANASEQPQAHSPSNAVAPTTSGGHELRGASELAGVVDRGLTTTASAAEAIHAAGVEGACAAR